MVLDVLQSFASQQSGSVAPAKYVDLTGLAAPAVSSSLQAIAFLLRLFIQHTVTSEQATALLAKETDLSEEKRSIVQSIWADHNKDGELLAPSKVSTVGRTLSLGRLVRFSWRVGVGISSSSTSQEQLATPFVTLSFEITQPSSHATAAGGIPNPHSKPTDALTATGTRTYLIECTHHEFQDVRKHFQDLFGQLDSM
jgi:hypothetical protein